MKRTLNKLIKNERGQTLLIVLVMMLLGSLIITPLLGLMSAGVRAGKVHEDKMAELYAADAGVEDALLRILNNNPSLPSTVGGNWTYSLGSVNDKDVSVQIFLEEDAAGFVDDLLEENYSGVHEAWHLITEDVTDGNMTLTVSYNGSATNKKIDGIGVWFWGTKWFCTDEASGADDITDSYPSYSFETRQPYKGGTAFLWKWTPGGKPVFNPGDSMSQSFTFTPAAVPAYYISWVIVGSADVGVVTSGTEFGTSRVISTATNITTGNQTAVTSYISWYSGNVSIITWEINLQ